MKSQSGRLSSFTLILFAIFLAIFFAFTPSLAIAEETQDLDEGLIGEASTAEGSENFALLADGDLHTFKFSGVADYAMANEELKLVNEQRAANNLPALVMNASLQKVAMQRAAECVLNFEHIRPNGEKCYTLYPSGYSCAGENIAAGQSSAEKVTTTWMNSFGHRANILSSDYTSIGVGCFKYNGVYFWVQCFTDSGSSSFAGTSATNVTYSISLNESTVPMDGTKSGFDYIYSSDDPESIEADDNFQLHAYLVNPGWGICVYPDADSFTWASSNPSVATVDAFGNVKLTGKLGTVTITAVNGDKTLSKVVQIIEVTKYTLKFDADGGTPAPKDQVILKDSNGRYFGTEPAAPSKKGYKFVGWYDGIYKWNFAEYDLRNWTLTDTFEVTLKAKYTRVISEVTMYRLYNPYSGEHLYTSDATEVKENVKLGWKDEGEAWVSPSYSTVPVYRLYNPYTSDHHYTKSYSEYQECEKQGWRGEDIAWYSADEYDVQVYRLFNPYETVGTHHYTTDQSEYWQRMFDGWVGEGVAWNALR